MLPIILDVKNLKVLLIGEGYLAEKRKKLLEEAGVKKLKVKKKLGDEKEIQDADIVFAAGFDEKESGRIARLARKNKVLVNVEDKIDFCDFHVPATVRRGDLLITSSTGGKSPRIARRLKEELERLFGEEWKERLDFIAKERLKWKKQGASFDEISAKTDAMIDKNKWFK